MPASHPCSSTSLNQSSESSGVVLKWLDYIRSWFNENRGIQVYARLAHAIGRATIAIGDSPTDFRGLGANRLAPLGLCVVVSNTDRFPVTITEVGLTRGEEGPQISLREPLLHDRGPWPRTLAPGEEVVAHFGSGLETYPLLAEVRRSYAATLDGRYILGDATALQHFLALQQTATKEFPAALQN